MWVEVGDFWDLGFEWGVTAFPLGPTPRRALATWPAFAGIPKTARRPDLAWEFLKYVTTEATLMRDDKGLWWRSGATMQSWKVRFAGAKSSVLSRDQLLNFYLDGLNRYTTITPINTIVGTGAFATAQGAKSIWPWLNKARDGKLSVQAALQGAETEVNAYLGELVRSKGLK